MNIAGGSTVKELLIKRARACVGVSTYRRSAVLEDAPSVFNCFRFTQWLWSSVGIQLPDHQLLYSRAVSVPFNDINKADLVFVPRLEYSVTEDDFGHVGIATGMSTIIHATKWKNGVTEESLSIFTNRGVLGVRRIPEQCYCRS
ncbi:MAG TPA: NlpC/P60 family protein [Candidatus Paceibacterota bacterium]|jgi:cell wall-associated NlpC family hydrolase